MGILSSTSLEKAESASIGAVIGVSIKVGATALTLTPLDASSTATLTHHDARCRLRYPEGGANVEVEHQVQRLCVDLEEGLRSVGADVVDQDVELFEAGYPVKECRFSYIADPCGDTSGVRVFQPLQIIGGARNGNHACAGVHQGFYAGAADALAGAGNERQAIIERKWL